MHERKFRYYPKNGESFTMTYLKLFAVCILKRKVSLLQFLFFPKKSYGEGSNSSLSTQQKVKIPQYGP